MKTSEVLKQAKSLIDTPDKWTQENFALSENDIPVDYDSPEACRFCAIGAVWRCDVQGSGAERTLRNAIHGYSIVEFNDNSAHDQVMAAFDLAIKIATEEEKIQQQ